MGLLKHLLFWPVSGPLFLARFSLDRVQGVVRDELTDDARVKAELLELQLALELGDIDDAEFVRREAELMAQLRDVRQWREEFGMGVSGGPVRVQGTAPPTGGEATAGGPAEATAGGEPGAAGPQVADPEGGAVIDLNLDWE